MINVISISGGKDSTALYLWAMNEFGASNFKAVFADTGHEHPITYNYLRNLPIMSGGPPIQWVKRDFSGKLKNKGKDTSGNPFLDLMLWKGRAPSTKAQFCTEHLKMIPIRDWLETIRGDLEVRMYVGIREQESARRSKMAEQEYSTFYDCDMFRPLLKWSETEVFEYLKERNIPPNPLYEAGFSRVGCFPCIHARKSELARLPEWVWEKLQEWETKLGRSWFPAGMIPGKYIPTIADVKEWATTLRGGKIQDPNPPDIADIPSCMSTWGTCE